MSIECIGITKLGLGKEREVGEIIDANPRIAKESRLHKRTK